MLHCTISQTRRFPTPQRQGYLQSPSLRIASFLTLSDYVAVLRVSRRVRALHCIPSLALLGLGAFELQALCPPSLRRSMVSAHVPALAWQPVPTPVALLQGLHL